MANVITRQHADKIASKLEAKLEHGKKKSGGAREHTQATVYHNGVAIAWFGIRRGSSKEQPHGHIPSGLHLGPNQCKKLADCKINRQAYLSILREKGLLAEDRPEAQERPAIRE